MQRWGMTKRIMPRRGLVFRCGLMLSAVAGGSLGAERTEHFDRDPLWHGHNNRAASPPPRAVRQDFGYSRTSHCGGAPGEIGGFITPASEPAFYAKKIAPVTFGETFSAAGKLFCEGREFHLLVGFFNAATVNEWRTPNTVALRLYGRGNVFYAYVEYCTGRWRAGGDSPKGFLDTPEPGTGRVRMKGFATGAVHRWSLRYDPNGNNGGGSVTATLDGETAVCHLHPGHKADGATFNRFGLLNVVKSPDTGGEVWFDDITINGETESFDRDPRWDGFQNRRVYQTSNVRPRFDFGYSPTHYAGGRKPGEMGGVIFRGDGRYPNLMAFYGDRLEELTLAGPLKASGRISLRRAVSDSDVPFGFFHAEHSLESGGSDRRSTPPDFLGFIVGGPSREGFMLVPAYRLHGSEQQSAERGLYLLPDGTPHDWALEYRPPHATADGSLTVKLDGEQVSLPLPRQHAASGAHFNRFGLITTHTDGNAQHLYFDDLTYTWKQSD
jgi:hypothetical protein